MSVPVYLAKLAVKKPSDHRLAKIKRLCDAVGLADKVKPLGTVGEDEVVAIKLHFGEAGNDTYLHPTFVRQVVDCVKATGARPFLTDTCTLYKSTRHNAVDHLETAYRHGFTPYVVDAPVIMADGVTSKCYEEVAVNLKHFASVKIAQAFLSANAMVVLSHFKGHAMGGFGGAIKNISIGIASSAGKAWIHSAGKTEDTEKLWSSLPAQDDFLESMAEAAKAIAAHCGERILYISVMNNLSVDCDCDAHPEPPRMGDIGILASLDPVALDQACVDLVYASPDEGKVHLIERMESRHGIHTLEHAEAIGIGSRQYELVDLDK